MPHESTVDPEEPMHVKTWGDEASQSDSPDRRRSNFALITGSTPRFQQSLSQTHPDLPLRVTHDHDDDGDPDEEENTIDPDGNIEDRSRVTYTPPKRKSGLTPNGKDSQQISNENEYQPILEPQ